MGDWLLQPQDLLKYVWELFTGDCWLHPQHIREAPGQEAGDSRRHQIKACVELVTHGSGWKDGED